MKQTSSVYLNMLFVLLLVKIGFALSTCGPSLHISGGSDADINDFPYQVSIRDSRINFSHICSGFIYKLNVVITAANCIVGRPRGFLQVYVGSDNVAAYTWVTTINKTLTHPEYDDQKRFNDIAILFLQNPIPESPTSKPIGIAHLEEIEQHNGEAIVTGWGCIDNKECFYERLQSLKVSILPATTCEKDFGKLHQMICAMSPKGSLGTCYGDNGNPLAIDVRGTKKIVGIVAFIANGMWCAGDKPTAYTKVPAFLDWIKMVTS